MSEAEWREAEAALKDFARRCGTLTRDEVDQRHFGNRLIEVSVGAVALRLVCDRGTPIITIGGEGRWHAPWKVFAFAAGLSPDAALDGTEPSMVEVIEHWPRLTATLAAPGLATFEEAVTQVYMDRVNAASRSLASPPNKAHASPSTLCVCSPSRQRGWARQ